MTSLGDGRDAKSPHLVVYECNLAQLVMQWRTGQCRVQMGSQRESLIALHFQGLRQQHAGDLPGFSCDAMRSLMWHIVPHKEQQSVGALVLAIVQ